MEVWVVFCFKQRYVVVGVSAYYVGVVGFLSLTYFDVVASCDGVVACDYVAFFVQDYACASCHPRVYADYGLGEFLDKRSCGVRDGF